MKNFAAKPPRVTTSGNLRYKLAAGQGAHPVLARPQLCWGVMVNEPDIHEDYGRAEEVKLGSERAFGVVFALVFAAVGLWPLMTGGAERLWALGAGV